MGLRLFSSGQGARSREMGRVCTVSLPGETKSLFMANSGLWSKGTSCNINVLEKETALVMLSGGHGQSDEVEIGFFFNPNTDVNINRPTSRSHFLHHPFYPSFACSLALTECLRILWAMIKIIADLLNDKEITEGRARIRISISMPWRMWAWALWAWA